MEDRGGRKIAFPPIGYTLPYDISRELPRPDFNTRLLVRLAEASGGETNPKPPATPNLNSRDMVTKTYQPLRQPFIILAFCFFLLEVAIRKFLFGEPD